MQLWYYRYPISRLTDKCLGTSAALFFLITNDVNQYHSTSETIKATELLLVNFRMKALDDNVKGYKGISLYLSFSYPT